MAYVKASTQFKRAHKKDYGRERIELLYEDKWIAVVCKDSGLLSVPYPGSKVRTAQNILEEIMRKKGELNRNHKPLCVHRLDRDTSGVMMFALSEEAQKIIMDNWHTMVTERLYRAVAENPRPDKRREGDLKKVRRPVLTEEEGLIDLPLAQNAHNVGFVPRPEDRDSKGRPFKTVPARTHYKMLERGKTHTLFELSLDTGKKNQIRAHLAYFGYPLAGDEDHRAHTNYFGRLCLHARSLEFVHPFTKEKLHFEVPEPEEWLEYVKKGDEKAELPIWEKSRNFYKR